MATCKNCRHLYMGGGKCPVCNYPNEDTHERLRPKREETSDGEGRCAETVETAAKAGETQE